MAQVRAERTGWRDEALSRLHRQWGWDCPMVDIDFLACEYDHAHPVAIVDYKNEHAEPYDPKHPSYRALAELGDRANLPSLVVGYAADFSWWSVRQINGVAMYVPNKQRMTQREYVEFLYRLRGRVQR